MKFVKNVDISKDAKGKSYTILSSKTLIILSNYYEEHKLIY